MNRLALYYCNSVNVRFEFPSLIVFDLNFIQTPDCRNACRVGSCDMTKSPHPPMTWWALVLLVSQHLLLVHSQACAATACNTFDATATACASSYNPQKPIDWVNCLCKNASGFDEAVQSCYDCDITYTNGTLVTEVQDFLDFCAKLNVTSNSTATAASLSGAGNTVTILDTVSSQTSSPTLASATSKPSTASPLQYPHWVVMMLTFIGTLLGIGLFCI